MVLFCPTCGNILLVEEGGGGYRFYCQTCPYIFPITSKVATTLQLPRKKVDDVMGEEAAWANAAREAGTTLAEGVAYDLTNPCSNVPQVQPHGGVLPAGTALSVSRLH